MLWVLAALVVLAVFLALAGVVGFVLVRSRKEAKALAEDDDFTAGTPPPMQPPPLSSRPASTLEQAVGPAPEPAPTEPASRAEPAQSEPTRAEPVAPPPIPATSVAPPPIPATSVAPPPIPATSVAPPPIPASAEPAKAPPPIPPSLAAPSPAAAPATAPFTDDAAPDDASAAALGALDPVAPRLAAPPAAPAVRSSRTLVPDDDFDAPAEAPGAAPEAASEPAPAPGAPPEPAAAPTVALEQVEKLRIADLGLLLRAFALRVGDEELLAFVSEGFAPRGRPELVLYTPRAACGPVDVVRALKRLGALSVLLLERPEPVRVGEVLKAAGEIGAAPLGGYLVLAANEPAPVPFGERVVLLGLPRPLPADAEAHRAAQVEPGGAAPFVTRLPRPAA